MTTTRTTNSELAVAKWKDAYDALHTRIVDKIRLPSDHWCNSAFYGTPHGLTDRRCITMADC
jgi:hypothetical protein